MTAKRNRKIVVTFMYGKWGNRRMYIHANLSVGTSVRGVWDENSGDCHLIGYSCAHGSGFSKNRIYKIVATKCPSGNLVKNIDRTQCGWDRCIATTCSVEARFSVCISHTLHPAVRSTPIYCAVCHAIYARTCTNDTFFGVLCIFRSSSLCDHFGTFSMTIHQ